MEMVPWWGAVTPSGRRRDLHPHLPYQCAIAYDRTSVASRGAGTGVHWRTPRGATCSIRVDRSASRLYARRRGATPVRSRGRTASASCGRKVRAARDRYLPQPVVLPRCDRRPAQSRSKLRVAGKLRDRSSRLSSPRRPLSKSRPRRRTDTRGGTGRPSWGKATIVGSGIITPTAASCCAGNHPVPMVWAQECDVDRGR